jgi:hypothetical protein
MAKANVLRLRAVGKNESKKRIYTATDRKMEYDSPALPVVSALPGCP